MRIGRNHETREGRVLGISEIFEVLEIIHPVGQPECTTVSIPGHRPGLIGNDDFVLADLSGQSSIESCRIVGWPVRRHRAGLAHLPDLAREVEDHGAGADQDRDHEVGVTQRRNFGVKFETAPEDGHKGKAVGSEKGSEEDVQLVGIGGGACFEAENGHPEPYNVKLWAVGNEMFGDWQLGHMPVEDYVMKHNKVAEAMWAVDPNIELIAVGYPGKWNDWMYENCADHMTYISEHFYKQDWHAGGLLTHVQQMPEVVGKFTVGRGADLADPHEYD